MKNTVNKLYGFIAKLVSLLEDELNEISSHKSKNSLNIKKNITDTLNKLVALIIKLNKLSKEEIDEDCIINKEDQDTL
jgi:superfamily I DNA and/or RNA helicase